jgi:hypothetical protein
VNHIYIWQDVEVLDFNPSSNRFKVRVCSSGLEKEIVKLSILFNCENKERFFQRLFMAKNLQLNAQDELRYKSYIENIQ